MHVITTSGDRAKAQPMFDSARLCAQFCGMAYGGELWGKGGPPNACRAMPRPSRRRRNFQARPAEIHQMRRQNRCDCVCPSAAESVAAVVAARH